MDMAAFLDRLMRAESGGKLTAKNSRSTALGPFQFIDGTFLSVARRHFATETAALTPAQVLALRTDMAFSRRAAEAYTHDNATSLTGAGQAATFQNLRLAYLLGPGGAIRILQADPAVPLPQLLPPSVLQANPFMVSLTAGGLVNRAAREVSVAPTSIAGIIARPGSAPGAPQQLASLEKPRAAPTITVNCDLGLASCRKWLALEQRRQAAGRNRTVRIAGRAAGERQ
jgi:hypothetical protein